MKDNPDPEQYKPQLPLEVLNELKVQNEQRKILVLEYKSNHTKYRFEDLPQCRAFLNIQPSELIKIEFNRREKPKVIMRILSSEICLDHKHFHFFGHSNSQLKARNVFFISRSLVEIDELFKEMGDFSEIKSTAKLSKRIGMLFSECKIVWELDPKKTDLIKDISRGNNLLTDGCGYISERFLERIIKKFVSPNKAVSSQINASLRNLK